jgi:hypothetical protein
MEIRFAVTPAIVAGAGVLARDQEVLRMIPKVRLPNKDPVFGRKGALEAALEIRPTQLVQRIRTLAPRVSSSNR